MPVVTLVSAKGSPGVTTAAAAIAAAATAAGDHPALLVELDPAGGDVRILTGAVDDSGVVGAAGELRRDVSSDSIGRHVSVAPPGLPVLLAPTAGLMATSVIGSVLDRWGPALRQHGGTVVVDGGRWDSSQPTARRAGIGDLVALVCRPTVAGVEHARQTVDRLREVARCPVVTVVVGNRPYAPAEVANELDLPLAGAIAWDPRGTSALWAKGITRAWGRTWLAASAATTLEGLLGLVAVAEPRPSAARAARDTARHRAGSERGTAVPTSATPGTGPAPAPPPASDTRRRDLPPPPVEPPVRRPGRDPQVEPPAGRSPSGGVPPSGAPRPDRPGPDTGRTASAVPAYGAGRTQPAPPPPSSSTVDRAERPAPPPLPQPVGPAPVSGEYPAVPPGGPAGRGGPPPASGEHAVVPAMRPAPAGEFGGTPAAVSNRAEDPDRVSGEHAVVPAVRPAPPGDPGGTGAAASNRAEDPGRVSGEHAAVPPPAGAPVSGQQSIVGAAEPGASVPVSGEQAAASPAGPGFVSGDQAAAPTGPLYRPGPPVRPSGEHQVVAPAPLYRPPPPPPRPLVGDDRHDAATAHGYGEREGQEPSAREEFDARHEEHGDGAGGWPGEHGGQEDGEAGAQEHGHLTARAAER